MLPNVIVIGAMKCGTTAIHRYLDAHPDIVMSQPKELNFFLGGRTGESSAPVWLTGTWQRGIAWYTSQFAEDAAVRGESSPGYTSPAHPYAAARMASVVPQARLVYLVRDPVERAVSQYCHHRAESTERRSVADALLDPASQYIARGRYFDRLQPFLRHYRSERILVLSLESMMAQRRRALSTLYRFVGVDDFWSADLERRWHTARTDLPNLDRETRDRLAEAFADDAERLRCWSGQHLEAWSV